MAAQRLQESIQGMIFSFDVMQVKCAAVPRRARIVQRFRGGLVFTNVQRFREGRVFKAHRWLYHSTLGSRVIKKKKK